MKILIVGCGSIGRRHALNAKSLGADVILCDINKAKVQEFALQHDFRKYYTDYSEAIIKEKPEAAVVATPSNFHLNPAIELASKGVHILMEKPLSISLDGVADLENIIERNGIIFMMAQSYRFHQGLLTLKKIIDENEIGRIYHVEMAGGWYLPDWHIHEDYRKEYAAQKALGGGVLLTSMSHAFDTIRWLYGEIIDIVGWKARQSDLEIDVEDYVSCLMRTDRRIFINMSDDFISRFPRSETRIFGTDGFISTDFRRNALYVWKVSEKRFMPDDHNVTCNQEHMVKILEDGVRYDPSPTKVGYDFSINDPYSRELEYFFKLVKQKITNFDLDIRAGKRVVELILSPEIHEI